MQKILYVTYETHQKEGIYWCYECRKNRHHKLYSPRDMSFYETASDEELAEADKEPDILKCSICVDTIERELRGENG